MRLLLAIAVLFFFFGCTLNVPASEKFAASTLAVGRFSPADEMVCQPLNDSRPCYCMVCENKTTWSSIFPEKMRKLMAFFDSTLHKGNCTFMHCNMTDFVNIISEKERYQMRSFMLGIGPSASAVDNANLFCNYSLQLSFKWLKGSVFNSPEIPSPRSAKCWLERNILPVYLYYTEGKNIDVWRTAQIAQAFNDVGPVLLSTEVWFDPNDPQAIEGIKGQIDAIKANCNSCLVVLMLNGSIQDRKLVLEKIFGRGDIKTGAGFSPYYQKVDVVGFGFLANDYPTCNPVDVIGENFLFSRFVLKKYSKPTLWAYVGVSKGNNSFGTCSWDEEAVHNFYQQLFASIQAMSSSGIIGVGFYEFSDYAGPLPCDNKIQGCEFGLLDSFGNQKHPAINTWSSLCQYFGTVQFRSPLIFSRNGYGSVCDPMQLQNNKMFTAISFELNSGKPLPNSIVPTAPKEKYLRCSDICVSDVPLNDWQIFDNTGDTFDSAHCDLYPFIEELAEEKEISALFFRAIVEQESNFNPYAVSCIDQNSPNCNPANLSIAEICRLANLSDDCGQVVGGGSSCPAGMKPCAFGIAQCIAYPGKYYVQRGIDLPLEIRNCGKSKKGIDYNPFDPQDSVCCGTSVLKYYLDISPSAGRNFVQNNWNTLTSCPQGIKDDKEWVAYFLAANTYYGYPNDFSGFLSQLNNCQGQQNYISYLRSKGYSYAARVLSRYLDAIDKCGSDCPGKAVQIASNPP